MTDRRLLALGTLLLGLLHAGCGLLRTGPAVVADEPGYLFGVRVLAGTGSGPLAGTSYYRGGWSLLLVPVELLTASPHAVFLAAVVVNAALAAAVVPLVFLVLRRHLAVPSRRAAMAALVAGCYPSLHVLSQAALPESLLAVLVLLAVLCVGELATGGGPGWGAGLGAVLAYAYATHGRSIALVGVGLGVLLVLAARRRVRPSPVLAALGVLGVGLVLGVLLDRHLRAAGYDGSAADDVGLRLRRLADGSAVAGTLRNLVGHTWYPAVASLGVLPLLVARWRDPDLRARVRHPAAVTAGLAVVGFLVLSAVFLSQPLRPDHLLYGRYVEAALPLLLGLGVAELLRRRPTRAEALGAATGLAALTAATLAVRVETDQGPNRWNVAALPAAPTGDLGAAVLLLAAGVALLSLVVLTRAAPVLLAGAFLGVAAYGQLVPVRSAEQAVYGRWTGPTVPAGSTVGVDPALRDPVARFAYPWFLPGAVELTTDADYVFAEAPEAGWSAVWRRGPVGLYATGR